MRFEEKVKEKKCNVRCLYLSSFRNQIRDFAVRFVGFGIGSYNGFFVIDGKRSGYSGKKISS